MNNISKDIVEITDIQLSELLISEELNGEYSPLGKYVCLLNEKWIAIDNSTGDAWIEEFKTKEEAIEWLENMELV